MGVPIEDLANGLPLGMSTKVVVRTNARNLIDMSHQRLCARAYWEYRQMMLDITKELSTYSEEWRILLDLLCKPKCEVCGFCTEEKSCGRKPKKEL